LFHNNILGSGQCIKWKFGKWFFTKYQRARQVVKKLKGSTCRQTPKSEAGSTPFTMLATCPMSKESDVSSISMASVVPGETEGGEAEVTTLVCFTRAINALKISALTLSSRSWKIVDKNLFVLQRKVFSKAAKTTTQ